MRFLKLQETFSPDNPHPVTVINRVNLLMIILVTKAMTLPFIIVFFCVFMFIQFDSILTALLCLFVAPKNKTMI
jgi:hypothetical protein